MKNDSTWGLYDRLRPDEIEAIIKEKPIAYLPWGALEYHGVHNPVGLDSIKAYHLCQDLAKEVGGVVMPVVNLAANLIKSYPGVNFTRHSIEFSEDLIKTICEEYLRQLALQDFKIIILLSGHAGEPHLQILKDVAWSFNNEYLHKYCWALAEFDAVSSDLLAANHSGLGETSLLLYYEHDIVNIEALPKKRAISLHLDAISGKDPRLSTANKGEVIVRTFVENASKKIIDLIEEYC